jgi:predicted RNA methylase
MAKGRTARRATQAARADRHALYERAVQGVEAECDFIADTFRKLRGRSPVRLREDFCGTAAISCHWATRGPRHTAIGVDLDPEVLAWARRFKLPRLKPTQRARVRLVEANVLDVRTPKVDAVCAFNFSYWIFKDREILRQYFRQAHAALVRDGVFFLDAFGGYEATRVQRERTRHRGFTYTWHQARFRPVTGEILCHIHFSFPDGSRMPEAFTYDWRFWSLPEIRELLLEAGFRRVSVYWEGTDGRTGRGNGEFTLEPYGEADAGWIAYLVAER